MHRHFFGKISQNLENIQTFAMMEEILFILLVVDGLHIKIHNVDIKKYNYMYSNTYNNMIIYILV